TNRAIMIADMAGCPVYIVRTSCEQAHEAIRRSRAKGMRVYGAVGGFTFHFGRAGISMRLWAVIALGEQL
ncbi:hypothetical protein ACC687_40835, partial [Rhizobium ruizarguesonis]